MDQVFLKTRELGQALVESEIYKTMKEAEDKAMQNTMAADTMARYMELRGSLQEMLSQPEPDSVKMKEISDEMDNVHQQLQNIDDIVALTKAREDFNNLIGQVNQVLQFIVTGKLDEPEGGCTGSCASCGGSCGLN
ncbi:MAG: YlbF family regulator [Clostridia bacterium]|nr:YlbF family regulator [Clostridia bacterium]